MKTKKPTEKTTRKRYSDEFKDQALKRAERDGVALVAQDLGIAETQIYAWRRKRQMEGTVTEAQRLQEAWAARWKRDGARLKEEDAFLKKAQAYGKQINRRALKRKAPVHSSPTLLAELVTIMRNTGHAADNACCTFAEADAPTFTLTTQLNPLPRRALDLIDELAV